MYTLVQWRYTYRRCITTIRVQCIIVSMHANETDTQICIGAAFVSRHACRWPCVFYVTIRINCTTIIAHTLPARKSPYAMCYVCIAFSVGNSCNTPSVWFTPLEHTCQRMIGRAHVRPMHEQCTPACTHLRIEQSYIYGLELFALFLGCARTDGFVLDQRRTYHSNMCMATGNGCDAYWHFNGNNTI